MSYRTWLVVTCLHIYEGSKSICFTRNKKIISLVIYRCKTFKEKDAKFYGSQICLALEYLHHLELVFRDLKPENIVLDTTGYLRLTDFGFCKVLILSFL